MQFEQALWLQLSKEGDGVCILMCLQTLEQFWLAKSPFLAGNEISIADLLHCCELDQLCLLDGADQVCSAHTVSSTLLFVFKSIPRLPACNLLRVFCQVDSSKHAGHSCKA